MSLICLAYVSTANSSDASMLDDICARSKSNNEAAGITGLLLFNGVNFLQVLEGEDERVKSVLAKIEKDPRHSGVIVIENREITERAFPDWSMRSSYVASQSLDMADHLPRSLSTKLRPAFEAIAQMNLMKHDNPRASS